MPLLISESAVLKAVLIANGATPATPVALTADALKSCASSFKLPSRHDEQNSERDEAGQFD
jgi:hypothetical protein